jgi:hypothetical protein
MNNITNKIKEMTPIKQYTILASIVSLILIIVVYLFLTPHFNKFILVFGSMWLFYLIIFMSMHIAEESHYYLL